MTWRLVLLGALAACGDDLTVPDALVQDSASRELVSIEVRSGRVGSGARVLIQDRDSTLLAVTKTDVAGRANAVIPDTTAFVTIELKEPETNERWLYTIQDVHPGDHVELDDGTAITETQIRVMVGADNGAVANYSLHTACGGGQSLDQIDGTDVTLSNCGSSAAMLVLSPLSNYLYRANVGIFPGASVNITGTYKPFETTRVRVTDVPPSVSHIFVRQALLDGVREHYDLPSRPFVSFDGFTTEGEVTLITPTWPDARAITRLTGGGGTVSAPSVWVWGPREEVTEIELASDFVRPLLTHPSFHSSTNTVSWLEGDQGRLPDATLVRLRWNPNDGFTTMHWQILAPRGTQSRLVLPRLPDSMYQPTNNVFVEDFASFAIEGGYERLRTLPIVGRWGLEQIRRGAEWPLEWPIDAPAGRVMFQSLNFSGGFPDR